VRALLAELRVDYAGQFALAEQLARSAQPPLDRARNRISALNYALRWRSRRFNPVARRLVTP
jgi:hypothetical protein